MNDRQLNAAALAAAKVVPALHPPGFPYWRAVAEAVAGALLPEELVRELRSTDPHVCSCSRRMKGVPPLEGCSGPFEGGCRFEEALRELVGRSTTDETGEARG